MLGLSADAAFSMFLAKFNTPESLEEFKAILAGMDLSDEKRRAMIPFFEIALQWANAT